MNNVHERVQTVTQKYHRVEKQSKKPSRMHKHPATPAGMPRCALACPGARIAAVSWPCPRPCRGKGSAMSQASMAVSQLQCCSPRAHLPTPQRPSASACSSSTLALSAYRTPSAVSWPPSRPYRRAQRRVAARPWPYRGRERAPGLRPACLVPQYNIFVLQPQKLA